MLATAGGIVLDEVEVKSNFKPKKKPKSSLFMDVSFAAVLTMGGSNGGDLGIVDNGGGGGRNEIGVTMSPMGLVPLSNNAVIEGARMKEYNNSSFTYAMAASVVLVADDATVVGVVDDALIPFIWAGASTLWIWDNRGAISKATHDTMDAIESALDPKGFKYVTYTKTNAEGLVYVGRTSGYGTTQQILKNRDSNHHMNKLGYGSASASLVIPATIDGGFGKRFFDPSYWSIRGSEQLQIDHYRKLGISGNDRNGISPSNDNKAKYMEWARKLLGL